MTIENKGKAEGDSNNSNEQLDSPKEIPTVQPGQRINTEGTDEHGNLRQSIPDLVTMENVIRSPKPEEIKTLEQTQQIVDIRPALSG